MHVEALQGSLKLPHRWPEVVIAATEEADFQVLSTHIAGLPRPQRVEGAGLAGPPTSRDLHAVVKAHLAAVGELRIRVAVLLEHRIAMEFHAHARRREATQLTREAEGSPGSEGSTLRVAREVDSLVVQSRVHLDCVEKPPNVQAVSRQVLCADACTSCLRLGDVPMHVGIGAEQCVAELVGLLHEADCAFRAAGVRGPIVHLVEEHDDRQFGFRDLGRRRVETEATIRAGLIEPDIVLIVVAMKLPDSLAIGYGHAVLDTHVHLGCRRCLAAQRPVLYFELRLEQDQVV
mmetsp:Transcript_44441/g.96636  ORF Transcript_44441/g.96636 Transcript_44441/m.96636 type:complete len:290 (+) Transcript_44441:236-1105(+)